MPQDTGFAVFVIWGYLQFFCCYADCTQYVVGFDMLDQALVGADQPVTVFLVESCPDPSVPVRIECCIDFMAVMVRVLIPITSSTLMRPKSFCT